MTEEDVRRVADEVLRDALGSVGFDRAEVSIGEDHDGDASFFVVAHFKSGAGITSGERSMSAHTALWTRLLADRESRFPYLDFRYPDDEVLAGEEEARSS